ncbi:MAG: glycoside hydrolase family 27 protein, partial [Anaerohalosphaera sp.]|nr:glycoside hydrolase family 27 protein [Anaerohalosphaera sp.]
YSAYYVPEEQRSQPTQFFGTYPGVLGTGLDSVGPYWFNDEDVQQWCDWGFDMVKMDWKPNDIPTVTRIYDDLQAADRDFVFSLSNATPFNNITEIASMCNLWRTTGDIHDSWSSMSSKGFGVEPWRPYSGPGHWNDQDMLQVGIRGAGGFVTEDDLRPTNLTPDEQYTQVSLWSLTACPLILSCDLTKLDEFTIGLLTNDEVIEVNQDPLGEQAARVRDDGDLEVWAKTMENGTKAVGLFNRSTSSSAITVQWSDIGIQGSQVVRDLWRQQDIGTYDGSFQAEVKGHGVVLVNIRPAL